MAVVPPTISFGAAKHLALALSAVGGVFNLLTSPLFADEAEPIAAIETVAELITAVETAQAGDVLEIAPGTYELPAPLRLASGVTLRGAGATRTVLRPAVSWDPGTSTLPKADDPNAYLISLKKASGVLIEQISFSGANAQTRDAPKLHGAIYARNCRELKLRHLRLDTFLWSGVRCYVIDQLDVHDCDFVDAGGRQKHTGGALYLHFVKNSEFWNNRVSKTAAHPNNVFGFKGYKATNCRIHHNTVNVGFSIEFPFENDRGNEIDHNVLAGTISIPKYAGGPVWPDGERSFHIHHNLIKQSYALEWSRNGVEVDHNLFDFAIDDDGGNLITDHGRVPAAGPTWFHHNLIRNPGRGIFWSKGGYSRLEFRNNHVIAETPSRSEGLFGFGSGTDFATITIADNVIECLEANPRPLLRSAARDATIINNRLENVSDASELENRQTGEPQGLMKPLRFDCGVNGEFQVDDWSVSGPIAQK